MPTNWTATNAQGVHLRDQHGQEAVQNFDAIINALPPAMRQAFDAERQARQQEIDTYVERHGYNT